MQQNMRSECPKCSRPLQKFNGHIGYCPQHHWVSPMGLGFEAEAAEQNRRDADAAEHSRLEQERRAQAARAQELRERHQSAVRKAVAVVIALALIAAAVVFYVVRPGMNYGNAAEKFAAGEYQAARDGYLALGNYKDAAARALLCEAMIDLQEGRPEDAAAKLDRMTGDGQDDVAKERSGALIPVIADWRAKGLTPRALLLLLSKADVIDPKGTQDIATLTAQGHAALLDGQQLAVYADDVNADGEAELIALNPDYSVTVYRMTPEGNARMAVDNGVASACETVFGNQYKDIDVNAAVACFFEAHRLAPNDDTRSALTAEGDRLTALFRETGISRYRADGRTVTFSRLLEGSIARYSDYAYEAVGTVNRPVRTGIDWQQNDYPPPESAAAVLRYFEARAYDIPDEAARLTAEPDEPGIFTRDNLHALAAPDIPGTVEAAAYQTEDGRALFEVAYSSGTQAVRAFIACEYQDGWKVVGAADTYGAGLATDDIDYAIALISLNAETTNTLSARGARSTYRLLVPAAGRRSR